MSKSTAKESKPVEYRVLGQSGLRVHPLFLGNMGWADGNRHTKFFTEKGCVTQEEDAAEILKKYVELGGNAIDTANIYQGGESEKLLGRLISEQGLDRDDLVIASKYSGPMDQGKPNKCGNHKKNMFQSVDESLKRLGLDYLDIFYVHFWDHTVKAEHLMRDLDTLVQSGKVMHIGISDAPAWQVAKSNTWADCHGREPFTVYQGRYSVIDRALEQSVIPMCQDFGMNVVNWGVFGQGKLTGKRTRDNQSGEGKRQVKDISEAEFQVKDQIDNIAQEIERTPTQVALRWSIQQPGVASTLIGPRTPEQLEDNMKTMEFELNEEQVSRLNNASQNLPANTFPESFIGTNFDNNPMSIMQSGYTLKL
eukprot:gb/GECH01012706.1/.p1 GENE.gb/GECH01012706.1/~~gb/GECH01012706.1/.p1  ORF type:complete len:365 (+),score=96.02 gb/GECH01012706.1/:1-1095(+)